MLPVDFDPIADFLAEDPIERLGVLSFGLSSWLVAVVQAPPSGLLQSLIQIVPPILGIYVAHRSMERAHELRMEKLRQSREKAVLPCGLPVVNPEIPDKFPFDRKQTAKPSEDTVDMP